MAEETKIKSKLAEVFELDKMPEVQREEFMSRVGNIVIDASLNRLLVDLSETEVEELQEYLEGKNEAEDPFSHLLKTYPKFESIVQEEITAFQAEAEAVVGGSEAE